MMKTTATLFCAFALAAAVTGDADAQNKCQGAKILDAAKKAECIAALQAKRVRTGTPIDPTKLAKCNAKVTDAYPKLEAKGNCNTYADSAAIESKVDTFVDDLVSELDVASPPSCPGAPCMTQGGCSKDGDCCSNHCDLTGIPGSCVLSPAGGCCQSANDCNFPTTCTAGRCACLPPGGGICEANAQCCSGNCPAPGAAPCQ